MMTMVIIAGGAFMLTMFLMRKTAGASRRDRGDGIRWRGIDWSRVETKDDDESSHDDGCGRARDHFKKSQD